MRRSELASKWTDSLPFRVAGTTGLLLALVLMLASPAFAGFEQVGTFGELSETSPYGYSGEGGAAVNATGAGGVPAGTVYLAGREGVNLISASGEAIGKLKEEFVAAAGVAVDQTTGEVYVLRDLSEGKLAITVYSADGSHLIASFGIVGNAFHETIVESPEKIHAVRSSGIAVDGSGTVYVADYSQAQFPAESRVMVFRPESPGDYEHYVYAGASHDIAYTNSSALAGVYSPNALAVDAAGNIYFKAQEGGTIAEFSPGEPSKPECLYQAPSGGVVGVTVNSQTGEVYYYTYKDFHIHQLDACNDEGKLVETGSFALTPKPPSFNDMELAFNPMLKYEGTRPAGAIYGLAADGLGYILALAESKLPVVESASTVSVAASGAVLGGAVNPKGFATRYAFQYISDAAYQANEPGERFAGAAEAPVGGGMLGGGTSSVSVEEALSGLSADTVYRWRLVASSHCNPADEVEVCEAPGATQVFRTFPSEPGGLPDGRAYELVSPVSKDGGEVFSLFPEHGSCGLMCKPGINGEMSPVQSSPDGEAVVYTGWPFSITEGATRSDEYISRRTANGWQTSILSPALHTQRRDFVDFDASLTVGVLEQSGDQSTLNGQAPTGYMNLYSEPTGGAAGFEPLVGVVPPNRAPSGFRVTFAGGSADYSRLFFEANDALTGATAMAPAAVDGGAEKNKNNLYESVGGSLRLVNVLPGNSETVPGAVLGAGGHKDENHVVYDYSHAISDDGSRVFWSDGAGQVYVREGGESTREIPDHAGKFLTASADGSKVLLSDGGIYDLETVQTTDLTEGHGGFQGIAGQSEDLSHVYFVDSEALTPSGEQNGNGEHAEAGKDNLYSWFEGVPTFVGALVAEDGKFEFIYGAWKTAPAERTAEASPNGRWLSFLSQAPLTGYDNSCGSQKVVRCREVFLYDSATGGLVCASCDRSGLPPLGGSRAPLLEDAPPSFGQPRYVTDQGRLYFDSQDSLSPFDVNNGVEDVYQFEPDGVGSCTQEGGCVNLISSGRGPDDSNFLAADATGKNVFFTTRDRLVAVDHDGLLDVYDAREGGGLASQSELAQQPECHGDACQPPALALSDPPLASLSFEGAGNLVQTGAPLDKQKKRPAKHKRKKHKRPKTRGKGKHARAGRHSAHTLRSSRRNGKGVAR